MNRYFNKRHEIKAICEHDGFPVDIATDVLRKRYGWPLTGVAGEELQEWLKMVRSHQLDKSKTLADLFGDD